MKVLTDLTQRVSFGLAISKQHYETGINTEPTLACQDWLPLGNGSAGAGSLRPTFSLSSASRDRHWQRVETIL